MNFFSSKKQAFFILIALTVLSAYSLKNLSLRCEPSSANEEFSVHFDWFGMDSNKIERTIAIPFEEKIQELDKLISFSCSCEYSKCVFNLEFSRDKESAFFDLSTLLEDFTKSLPSDVQKARLFSNASNEKWTLTAAFDANEYDRKQLERKIKSSVQKIPDISQVLFLGGMTEEIQIAFNDKELSDKNKMPWLFSHYLQSQNASEIFGEDMCFSQRNQSLKKINSIKEISNLASVKIGAKEKDSIARINGKECILLCLKSSSNGPKIRICKEAKRLLKNKFPENNAFTIVLDKGKEEEKMLFGIISAFLQSALALSLTAWFFYRSIKTMFKLLLWTALDLLFSLAILCALKKPLDGAAISGITISLGLICDGALYMSDDCRPSLSAMIIASLTSICALTPLFTLEKFSPGIKSLALACALSVGVSVLLTVFFFQLFFFEKNNPNNKKYLNLSTFSYIKDRKIVNLSYFLYILTIVIFILSPKNLNIDDTSQSIYAQIEWPCEKKASFIDKELEDFSKKVMAINGVEFVQTDAKRGSAEVNVILKNPRRKNKITKEIQNVSSSLTGNLYLPLAAPKNKNIQKIQFYVFGKEQKTCIDICKKAAEKLLSNEYFVKAKAQTTFHFKENEKILIARPMKNLLDKNNISCKDFAHFLRWNNFGAVVFKNYQEETIQDIRVANQQCSFGKKATLENINKMQINGISVAALCDIKTEKRPEKTFRKNGHRAASMTLEFEGKNSSKAFKELKSTLKKMYVPNGFYIVFPKEYEDMNKNYFFVFMAFLLAVFITYILIAGHSEQPVDALKAIMTIPLSIFLPLAIRFASRSPLTTGDAVAMVFVSGICVNNAIYIMNEWNLAKRKNAFKAAACVSKSVLSSTATSMVCSLPVIFNSAGSFAGNLAFFTFFGSFGSLAASLFVFPMMLEKKGAPPKKGAPKRKGFRKRLIWPRLPCSEELSS